jgi:predicted nuclease of predicted toxin-antitoxin system
MSEDAQDRDIWLYAQDNGFTIVTKDDDFEQRSVLLGHPPKVIWIRLGNCKTEQVLTLLLKSKNVIQAFDQDSAKSTLPLPF